MESITFKWIYSKTVAIIHSLIQVLLTTAFFLLWQHRTTILCETVCKRKYLFILEIIYVLLTKVISMESITFKWIYSKTVAIIHSLIQVLLTTAFFLLWQHRTTILCETVCKRKYLFILEIIYVLLTKVISMESVTLNRLE